MHFVFLASMLLLDGGDWSKSADTDIPSIGHDLEYQNYAGGKQSRSVSENRQKKVPASVEVGTQVSQQAVGPIRTYRRSDSQRVQPERVIHVRSGLGKVRSSGSYWMERIAARQATRNLVEQNYEKLRGCYSMYSGPESDFRDSPIKFTLSFTYNDRGQLDQIHTVSGHEGYYRLTECVLDTLAFASVSTQEIHRGIKIDVPLRFWASRPFEIDLGRHLPTCDNVIYNNSNRKQGQIGATCSLITAGPGQSPPTVKP